MGGHLPGLRSVIVYVYLCISIFIYLHIRECVWVYGTYVLPSCLPALFVKALSRSLLVRSFVLCLQTYLRPSFTTIPSLQHITQTGGLGLAWLALWVPLASDRPPQQQALAAAQATAATATIAPAPASEAEDEEQAATSLLEGVAERVWGKLTSVPWGDFVRSPELWAVTFAHMVRSDWRESGGLQRMLAV